MFCDVVVNISFDSILNYKYIKMNINLDILFAIKNRYHFVKMYQINEPFK